MAFIVHIGMRMRIIGGSVGNMEQIIKVTFGKSVSGACICTATLLCNDSCKLYACLLAAIGYSLHPPSLLFHISLLHKHRKNR